MFSLSFLPIIALQVVKRDADIANGEAEKVQAVKQECEDDLAVAMPILESALKVRVCDACTWAH